MGLLGHNGAGKTTMVSQIVGLLKPDSGRIHVAGVDAVADPARARRQVSVQSQSQAPVEGLTPRGAIEISAKLRGGRSEYVEQAVEAPGRRVGDSSLARSASTAGRRRTVRWYPSVDILSRCRWSPRLQFWSWTNPRTMWTRIVAASCGRLCVVGLTKARAFCLLHTTSPR
ncbi:ATP-binding cassette domain-containing protein [Corynebacterium suedekumii]|nr:ATP-binding cassette domain-containing protein [Corynebacterium suedekumii]